MIFNSTCFRRNNHESVSYTGPCNNYMSIAGRAIYIYAVSYEVCCNVHIPRAGQQSINSSPCAWMKSFLNKWNLLYHQCICIVMPKPSGKHVRYLDVRSARMRIEPRRWRIYMTPRTKSQLGITMNVWNNYSKLFLTLCQSTNWQTNDGWPLKFED